MFVVEDRGRATVDGNAQRGRGCFFNDCGNPESGVFDLDGNQKKPGKVARIRLGLAKMG